MSFQRVQQLGHQSPQASSSTSQFAPRPFSAQEPKPSSTKEEIESKAFQQNKSEAFGLQLKEKYGTITPVEQERLITLQTKMDSFWVQRAECSKAQPNLLEILTRNAQVSQASKPAAPVQPKLTYGAPNNQYEQVADCASNQVVNTAPLATSSFQRQTKGDEIKTKVFVEPITPLIQHQETEELESVQTKCAACEAEEAVQRKQTVSRTVDPISVLPNGMAKFHIARWGDGDVSTPKTGTNLERSTRLAYLLIQITTHTTENLQQAQSLQRPFANPADQKAKEDILETGRSQLIDLLEERITLLDVEISALQERIGPNPSCSAAHSETDQLTNELMQREQERRQHQQQLRPLKRWQQRRDINSIDADLAEIDAQISTLTPANDLGGLLAILLQGRRNELEQQKRTLAASLTSDVKEYKQSEEPWGGIHYGQDKACGTIKEGGCGPTSLAIVLNFLHQEDPESLAASGVFEIVTPTETAKYAETNGRVCGHGTAGDPMVTHVETQWPGFKGRKIDLATAPAQLRSGNLVIFLCKNCTGQKRKGGTKTYVGHFMVLSGVDEQGKIFNVLDPGNPESADIETISKEQLSRNATGFWIVERK